jgi:hypothetical protein
MKKNVRIIALFVAVAIVSGICAYATSGGVLTTS